MLDFFILIFLPWADRAVEHQFLFRATLEDVPDGREEQSDFVAAAAHVATAAAWGRMDQSAPKPLLESLGEEAGLWDKEDLEALHAHLHCSASTG